MSHGLPTRRHEESRNMARCGMFWVHGGVHSSARENEGDLSGGRRDRESVSSAQGPSEGKLG